MRSLKFTVLVLIAAGIALTLYLAGSSNKVLISGPFLLFAGAVWIGYRARSGVCTLAGLAIAVIFGALTYHEAFVVHQHGEADAIAVIIAPIVQSVIGLLVLLIAINDRLHLRFSKAN
jgi:hypothetical protein